MDVEDAESAVLDLPAADYGAPRTAPGKWASYVRLFDLKQVCCCLLLFVAFSLWVCM